MLQIYILQNFILTASLAFFLTGKTVTPVLYLDMEHVEIPQVDELQPHVFLQQVDIPHRWVPSLAVL